MKRTLSLLLCLTLLFGVSGFSAWADNLNVDSYYTLPESMTVDGVTITSNGQIMVSDEKILSVLGDIDSAAARASLTIENAKLKVGGNFNADGNTPSLVIRGSNGAEIKIDGDLRAKTSRYGTALAVSDGTTVEIGGSVIGNTGENNQNSWTIEAGSWSSGDMRLSYVRVGKDLKGNIAAYDGSTINVNGNAEGSVYASGEGASISIGDYLNGEIDAYNHAAVSVHGDVVSKVKAIQDDYVRRATAIIAQNGAAVTVDGSVSAINSDGSLGTGIYAYYPWNDDVPDASTVKVTGDVQGQIDANYGTTIDVKGHAEGSVDASGDGTSVTIGDGVKCESDKLLYNYSDYAVSASDHATVSITGDVVSKVKAIEDDYVRLAFAITALHGAAVTVDGNVSAINSDGSLGIGINAYTSLWNLEIPEESSVEVSGNVQGQIRANHGSSIDVKGHAEGGINAENKDTAVTIGKDVKGNISAQSGSSVDVQGHVAGFIHAWGDGTHVKIGDGVSLPSDSYGPIINTWGHAQIDVNGDVDGDTYISESRVDIDGNVGKISTYGGSTVDVSGNAERISISNSIFTSEIPDDIDLGNTVRVGGDVANGVYISMYSDGTDHSKVTVEGTVSSDRNAITLDVQPHVVMDIPYPSYPIRTTNTDDAAYQKAMEEYRQAEAVYIARQRELLQQARNEMNTAEGVQTVIDNLPQIIVGTLAPDADFVLVNGMMNKDNQKKITEALLSQINYIVNMEGVDTANIAVYGYEELDGYLVAREQQKLTVKCINDNMVIATVSAGRYASIEENKDGSYTITVQRGGDLNLVVTARPKVVYASMDSDSGADYSGTNSAYDEAQWSGWLSNLSADYANHKLFLDLRTVLTTDIPYDTLRAYLADYGIGTLLVITENAEYTMTLSELLALAEEGDTFTFSVRDGALELAVNGSVVSTFSVE